MKTFLSYLSALLIAIPAFSQNQGPKQQLVLDGMMFDLFEPEGEAPYAVMSLTTSRESSYEIPASVTNDGKNYPVTEIGYMAFFGKEYMTSVTIPSSVTTIGESAFAFCEALTSVTLPNSVTTIGDCAFQGPGVRDLILPPSVTSVGDNICDCIKVAIPSTLDASGFNSEITIIYPADDCMIADNCVYSSDKSTIYYAGLSLSGDYTVSSNVSMIGEHAFAYCSNLTSVSLPNSVTTVGDYAFRDCEGLTSVSLTNSVTDLGNATFSDCKALTSFTIPSSVSAIGDETFKDCRALTSITIPNSVKTIGKRAFAGCSNLAEVTIPGSVNTIGEEAFYCGISELILPPSVTSIGRNICSKVKVAMPSTLDAGAFDYSTVITYPADNNLFEDKLIYSSDKSAIYYASLSLSGDCTIPSTVRSIGRQAFIKCKDLTAVTIPGSVTAIGDSAFYASGLIELILPPSVTSVGKSICHPVKTAIPSTLDADTFNYSEIVTYPIDNYLFEDNFIFSSDKSTLYFASAKLSGDCTIPSTVSTIGYRAFAYCTAMTSVAIPGSVTTIGDNAFLGCTSLTSVALPNSVTAIGDSTFCSCGRLASVIIPNSVTTIGGYAFGFCRALTSVTIPNSVTTIGDKAFSYCEGLTSVDIPNSVTTIGESAFSYCSVLKSVIIPNSVSSIGKYTFWACIGLTSVTIPGSVTTIGESAFAHCQGLTSVDIPNSVTDISYGAFFCCKSLTSVTIPESVTAIGAYAFQCCEGLTSVSIPGTVNSIGEGVFSQCYKLTEINYNTTSPITADKNIFEDVIYNDATLNIAAGGLDKARTTEPWMYFANIQEKGIDQSGVTEVTADGNNDALAEYYDLRGVRIIKPERGKIYIVRRGDKVTKELIR